jgi:predicted Fe-Mo cluster-binding NifX family protein
VGYKPYPDRPIVFTLMKTSAFGRRNGTYMKIAVSISGKTLDSPFDSRFGRAALFCIVETETDQWNIFENPAISASGGAGVQAAQFVAEKGVQAVISGAFGPNAYDTLAATEIKMFLAPMNEVYTGQKIVDLFKAGELAQTNEATHGGHHGGAR